MTLSFCYNWEAAAMEHPIVDTTAPLFEENSEVAVALLGFLEPVDSPLLPLDSLFDTQEIDDVFSSPSPPIAAADNSIIAPFFSNTTMPTLPPPPPDDGLLYLCPKRHCSCSDLYLSSPPSTLFEPSTLVLPNFSPIPSSGFAVSPPLCRPSIAAGGGSGRSFLGQSAAARERRKRISEKTQELGRLIPGGSKMNTAEMLHAAHKYVRFLQAQANILGLMGSAQASSYEAEDHLQVLLASPAIQEMLSNEGRCIVPKMVVHGLSKDPQLKFSPLVSKAMGRFIETISEKTYGTSMQKSMKESIDYLLTKY